MSLLPFLQIGVGVPISNGRIAECLRLNLIAHFNERVTVMLLVTHCFARIGALDFSQIEII